MSVDARSEKNIQTLLPAAQPWARAHVEAVNSSGILPKGWRVKITSGNRTWAEQNELYREGRRGIPGEPIVTKAKGGQSRHNYGIAWDLSIFDEHDRYLKESPYYEKIVKVGRVLGLECGADWDFVDMPHYQTSTGLSIKQLFALYQAKKPIPVPVYGGGEPLVLHVEEPKRKTVKVLENGEETGIDAFIEDGRVWVAVRKFCHEFGGEVFRWNGDSAEVMLDSQKMTLPAIVAGAGLGFVKFADINRLAEWPYSYKALVLDVDTREPN